MQYTTAKKSDREPWRILAEPSTESWLYLACWTEKQQKDAKRWIVERVRPARGGLSLKNINPVIRARELLLSKKYLRREPCLRNPHLVRLLSMPKPFIPYAQIKLGARRSLKGNLGLSDDEQAVVVKILDSDWFRRSFSADLAYEQVGFQGALPTLAEFVEEVFAVSVLSNVRSPSTRAILDSKTFDDFMRQWSATHLENRRIRRLVATVSASVREKLPEPRIDLLLKNTLDHLPMAALCMPSDLVEKLERVGRIPFTLAQALGEGVRRAEEELS